MSLSGSQIAFFRLSNILMAVFTAMFLLSSQTEASNRIQLLGFHIFPRMVIGLIHCLIKNIRLFLPVTNILMITIITSTYLSSILLKRFLSQIFVENYDLIKRGRNSIIGYLTVKVGDWLEHELLMKSLSCLQEQEASLGNTVTSLCGKVKGDVLKVVGGDAEKLLLLTNHNSDKINLRTFDIETQQFAEVVFEHPFYDLTAAIRHPETKDIIGVAFIEKGMAKQVYFSDDYNALTTRLSKSTEIEGVYAVDMDKSGNNIIFVADDSANPGQTYYYNRATDSFSHLIDLYPWLSNKSLSKTKLLRLEAEDGVTLEAFLTLPSTKNPPLVVIPHGGPIGVSDSRHYSGNIQVLVDAGFATLQVNYRGSAGYGKAFKQQGLQQWGRLIEDDIEQALAYTKENYDVNPNQVCIVGGSYGGYSALYSVIRSPQLYKCAASFAGVTDLALRFQRSDAQRDDMMRALTEIMGDPKTQQDELFKYSPLYQFKGITKPVFIAHGTDDNIVDIEHSYRLHFALKDHGIKHKWMVMDDVGHGFSDPDDAAVYYNALIEFLNSQLNEE